MTIEPNSNGMHCTAIRLPAKAVTGLLMMNEKKRSKKFDISFLKAMLIGFFTLKKIKENASMDEGILEIVKGKSNYFIHLSYYII